MHMLIAETFYVVWIVVAYWDGPDKPSKPTGGTSHSLTTCLEQIEGPEGDRAKSRIPKHIVMACEQKMYPLKG